MLKNRFWLLYFALFKISRISVKPSAFLHSLLKPQGQCVKNLSAKCKGVPFQFLRRYNKYTVSCMYVYTFAHLLSTYSTKASIMSGHVQRELTVQRAFSITKLTRSPGDPVCMEQHICISALLFQLVYTICVLVHMNGQDRLRQELITVPLNCL